MALGPFQVAQQSAEPSPVRGVVLLMRHGETAWNREGRVMGRHPVELDHGGRQQVEGAVPTARILGIELVVSSPLTRARQSADIIAQGVGGVQVIEEPRLEEVRYGKWEAMTFHDLIKDQSYLDFRKAPITSVTPGGETLGQVQARGVEAVTRTLEANAGKRILFVSHGDIIRTILCHFMGLGLDYYHRIRVDNAAFFGLEVNGRFAEIKFFNLMRDPDRAFRPPFPK